MLLGLDDYPDHEVGGVLISEQFCPAEIIQNNGRIYVRYRCQPEERDSSHIKRESTDYHSCNHPPCTPMNTRDDIHLISPISFSAEPKVRQKGKILSMKMLYHLVHNYLAHPSSPFSFFISSQLDTPDISYISFYWLRALPRIICLSMR